MLRPKRLHKGDTIGVISPASPSERKSEIKRAVETLEEWGYKVVVGKNVNKCKGFVAASEEERASDFNEMFLRDDIDAVFVTQGGYGSAQIIRLIDFEVVRKNPKIFTGFSDITSLHLALHKFSDLVTFHGPGMSRFNSEDLTDYTKEYFFKAVSETEPIGNIPPADKKKWIHTIGSGTAEGPLIGGNLTLICASLGTPYAIDTKDKILLIEDVDTEPWIFDHMLSHLRNAGCLDHLKGIVVGECQDCVPFKHNPGFYCDVSVEDVLEYYLRPLNIPVLYGLPFGHTKDLATLPLGLSVRLDADRKTFEVLESGVL
ncbi:LD-carboxypeptidase [Bacillota bacterium]